MAPSLYATWLAPTLLPIISWKEGVHYSNYSREKGKEPAIIGSRKLERERELEFPITITRELEFPIIKELERERVTIIRELKVLLERQELFLIITRPV